MKTKSIRHKIADLVDGSGVTRDLETADKILKLIRKELLKKMDTIPLFAGGLAGDTVSANEVVKIIEETLK